MKPVYVSKEHEVYLSEYLYHVNRSVKEATSDTEKYQDFLAIGNVIIEYHNNYSEEYPGNYRDFLMIIPLNYTSMVSGFFCGLENRDNRDSVRIYSLLCNQRAEKLIEDIGKIKVIHE